MAMLRRPLLISCVLHVGLAALIAAVVAPTSAIDEPTAAPAEVALLPLPAPPPAVVAVEMTPVGGTVSRPAGRADKSGAKSRAGRFGSAAIVLAFARRFRRAPPLLVKRRTEMLFDNLGP